MAAAGFLEPSGKTFVAATLFVVVQVDVCDATDQPASKVRRRRHTAPIKAYAEDINLIAEESRVTGLFG